MNPLAPDLASVPVLDVFVPGQPAAQGSKRHVGGGRLVEQSKAVAPWRTLVAWYAAQGYTGGAPAVGPLAVRIEFVVRRPSGTPKRAPTPAAVKRPDVDKQIRAVFDALSGVVWRDDSQAVDVHATKRIAERDEQPGARIRITATQAVPPPTTEDTPA